MITLRRTDSVDPDFQILIKELDREFNLRYTHLKNTFASANMLSNEARVVLASVDDIAIACGAFRPINDRVVEIKRMFTRPEYRNQGVGKKVLNEIEAWARSEGFTESILETGIRQPEAIAAYEKSGYARIPNFPPYENVIESICYTKKL